MLLISHRYTEKCLNMCSDPMDVEQMKISLHARIGQAIAKKEVEKDWSNEPPPFIPSPPTPTAAASSTIDYNNLFGSVSKKESLAQQKRNQQRMQRAGRFQDDHKHVKKRTMVINTNIQANWRATNVSSYIHT